MNMKEIPKLSFCIPTYNRADMVVECVNKILEYKGDDIEVVVSDNCSKDYTLEKLRKINDNRLKIFTNDSNLGYTKNLIKVLSHATGKYCFLVSDEDRVIDGKIPNILKLIQKTSYGLILTSVRKENIYRQKLEDTTLKQNIKNKLRPFYHYVKYGRNLTDYYIYHKENIDDKVEIIKKIYSYTYLTGLILKKDLIPFDEILSNDYIDMNVYPQVLIMLLISDKSSTCFSNEAFTVMNEVPLKSHIIDEKKASSQSYPHPLARMNQMIDSFEWLGELNLSDKEKQEITFFMLESFLSRANHGFEGYTSQKEKKVSDVEFKVISKQVYKTAKEHLMGLSCNNEYQEYIIKVVGDFMETTINTEN